MNYYNLYTFSSKCHFHFISKITIITRFDINLERKVGLQNSTKWGERLIFGD